MRLSILIPAHNEEKNIVDLLNKIKNTVKMPCEIIVVNDYSTDLTSKLVSDLAREHPDISLIDNLDKAGFANAIKTGLYNIKTEVVVPLMADLCDDLSIIKSMFQKIEEGYDIVCGSRYIKGGARLGGSRLKKILSFLGGWSINFILGIPTHDIANAFKMYRKQVIDSIQIESKSFEVSMEIPLKAYYLGFKITEVPTIWRERTKGKSSFKIFKLLPRYLKLYIWAIFKKITR